MALSLFCRAGLQAGRRCAVQAPVHAAYPSRSMVSTPCAAVCVPGARVLPTCGPNAQVQVRRVSLALPVPVVSSLPAACAPLAPTPLGPMVGTLSPWAGQAGFASSVAAPAALSKRESLEDKLERWDNLTQEFLAYETAPSLDNLADRAIHLMREVGKDAPGMGKRMGKVGVLRCAGPCWVGWGQQAHHCGVPYAGVARAAAAQLSAIAQQARGLFGSEQRV